MKILFFTPFAKRNGAEMMLWYLMQYASKNGFECAVYSSHEGELLNELPNNVKSYTGPKSPPPPSFTQRISNKIKGKSVATLSVDEYVSKINDEFKPDLWYINTILCTGMPALAIKLGVPYAVHFHELLFLYQHVAYDELKSLVNNASLLLGCSKRVCEYITIMGGRNVALQYECVDIAKISQHRLKLISKKDLGIPDNKFVWIMSGSVEYRKGTDIIPLIAKEFANEAVFLWLGPGSSGYSYFIESELKYYGIDNFIFLGAKTNDYYSYLNVADGLFLSSREDPFPLVMIEGAALGKPIVAFNSGGAEEFVLDEMGLVVDGFDNNEIVSAMRSVMYENININKNKLIHRAAEFDIETQASNWAKTIDIYFDSK